MTYPCVLFHHRSRVRADWSKNVTKSGKTNRIYMCEMYLYFGCVRFNHPKYSRVRPTCYNGVRSGIDKSIGLRSLIARLTDFHIFWNCVVYECFHIVGIQLCEIIFKAAFHCLCFHLFLYFLLMQHWWHQRHLKPFIPVWYEIRELAVVYVKVNMISSWTIDCMTPNSPTKVDSISNTTHNLERTRSHTQAA